MFEALGVAPFAIEQGVTIKKYPSCLCGHATLDGLFAILARRDLDAEEIEHVTVEGSAMLEDPMIHREPATGHEARFSLPYHVAVALVDKEITPTSFNDRRVRDARVVDLMAQVEVKVHPDWSGYVPTALEIRLKSGDVIRHRQDHVSGHADLPLEWAEVVRKYRVNASSTLSEMSVEASIGIVENLEALGARDLTGALAVACDEGTRTN